MGHCFELSLTSFFFMQGTVLLVISTLDSKAKMCFRWCRATYKAALNKVYILPRSCSSCREQLADPRKRCNCFQEFHTSGKSVPLLVPKYLLIFKSAQLHIPVDRTNKSQGLDSGYYWSREKTNVTFFFSTGTKNYILMPIVLYDLLSSEQGLQ